MYISNRGAAIALALLLSFAAGSTLAADVYKTATTAQVLREGKVARNLKVEFDGIPGPPEQMRAIFHEEMERRKYRIDPVAETVMTIRWNGPFRESDRQDRLQLKGKGGNQSRTELGFSLALGSPAEEEGETTYSLGASVADRNGEVWKGKVIVVTASKQKSSILRQMTRQLLDSVGGNIAPTGSADKATN